MAFNVETINEKIADLLSLQDGDVLTYDEYYRGLRELIAKNSFGAEKFSQEFLAFLVNERKRVAKKPGSFKTKRQKARTKIDKAINFIKPAKEKSPIVQYIKNTTQYQSREQENSKEQFSTIRDSVENIYNTILNQQRLYANIAESNRKDAENEKRKKKEEKLEKSKPKILDAVKNILSPFQSIFDRIIKFITFAILGRALKLFMDWTSDPKNKEKVEVLTRFLKDWWPALLGTWFLFAHPIGRFIRAITGTVVKLTFRLAKFAIPRLLTFIKANPLAAGVAAIAGTTLLANEITGQREAAKIQTENKAKAQTGKGLGVQGVDTPVDKSPSPGSMGSTTPYGLLQPVSRGGFIGLNKGGFIPSIFSGVVDKDTGETVSGAGPDTQFLPVAEGGGAVLQRGEIVLQKGARERMINQVGVDPLAFNIGSNANKPRSIGANVLANAYGGLVGFNNGGEIGGQTNLLKPQAKTIFDRLVKGGLTPTAAAGIVANIGVETGYTYDPNTHQRGGGPGRGLVQWERGGRFDTDKINLMSFAKSRGTSWNNLNTQVDFILHEMNTHPEYKRVKSRINTAKDVATSTNIFLREYEKAGVPHTQDRLKVAQQLISAGYLKPQQKKVESKSKKQPSLMQTIGQFASNLMGMSSAYAKPQKRKGGGTIVGESDGINIPGATDDRQMFPIMGGGTAALHPGEGIVPRDVMQRIGEDGFNRFIATFESGRNSNAAKLGYTKPKVNIPSPPSRSNGNMVPITLPPITQSSGAKVEGSLTHPKVPGFSAVSSASIDVRQNNADMYGIVG
jgi:hypothetical protein